MGFIVSTGTCVDMEATCRRDLLEHNEFRHLKIGGAVKILMHLRGQSHLLKPACFRDSYPIHREESPKSLITILGRTSALVGSDVAAYENVLP